MCPARRVTTEFCGVMDGNNGMKVLVIIPAYNEAANIVRVVRSIESSGCDYIVVNDGSSDATAKICRKNSFRFLDLKENLGIGGAIQAGHRYALREGYDIDIQFDGDGQHDASCIPLLIEGVMAGADLVIGSRFIGSENEFKSTFMRRVGIRWLCAVIRLFGVGVVSDPTSGFRACGRTAIQLFSDDYPVDYPEPESIVSATKAGLVVKEVPVIMHERQGGTSSIGAISSIYYMIKVTLAILILGMSSNARKDNQ